MGYSYSLVGAPEAETVTVAERAVALVLAEPAVTVMAASLEPEVGETVSQAPSSEIVQEVFEVILNVPLAPEAAASDTVVGDTERVTVPVWVTVTVWSDAPEAETVTVAERAVALVFAELAVTVMAASLEPEVGETVSQAPSSEIVQEVFEVILNVPFDPEAAASDTVVGDTERVMVPVWVTVTVWSDAPEAETVTVAERAVALVFAELAVTVMAASLEPEVGETVSQAPSSEIVQEVFEVILNVPLDPEAAASDTVVGDTERVTVPVWVTVTVWSDAPEAETVTVAERAVALVFAELAVTVMAASFEPEVGETVSQAPSSEIVQEVFEVILNVPFDPEAAASDTVVGDTERVTVPVWVTVTVWSDAPEAETVTVAERAVALVFAELAVTVMAASFEPEVGETVSQAPSSKIVHDVFEVILNVPFDPEAAASDTVVGDTERVTVPVWVTVTVWSDAPEAETVTVAERAVALVFAELAVTVTAELSEPETGETVSQVPSSEIVQDVFEVISNVPFDPEGASREISDDDKLRNGSVPDISTTAVPPTLKTPEPPV